MRGFTVTKTATGASLVLAAAALLIPVNVGHDARLELNDACAAGQCCPEPGAICEGVGPEPVFNAYYSTDPCPPPPQQTP